MINLFTIHRKNDQLQNEQEVYQILDKFYRSFFDDMYNELNIDRYRQIRDAIGLVMRKFDEHDHPMAYTSKLVMYIQSRVVMNHLPLTNEQQNYMRELCNKTKYVNLNYVYSGPVNDAKQFLRV